MIHHSNTIILLYGDFVIHSTQQLPLQFKRKNLKPIIQTTDDLFQKSASDRNFSATNLICSPIGFFFNIHSFDPSNHLTEFKIYIFLYLRKKTPCRVRGISYPKIPQFFLGSRRS